MNLRDFTRLPDCRYLDQNGNEWFADTVDGDVRLVCIDLLAGTALDCRFDQQTGDLKQQFRLDGVYCAAHTIQDDPKDSGLIVKQQALHYVKRKL